MGDDRDESDSGDSDEDWVSWFCCLAGNKFFCDVERSYIEDNFNLFGLKQYVPKHYAKALDMILDKLGPSEPETEDLSKSAALLYGLIHARYIITPRGLDCMQRKYINREFGECPRTMCRGQPVLPMGVEDEPRVGMVKVYCPKCRDVYNCHANQRHIDGAFFGTTFPNLFFMNFEELLPEQNKELHVPRVFGFKLHDATASTSASNANRRHHRGVDAEAGREYSGNAQQRRRVFIGDSLYVEGAADAATGAGNGSRVKEIMVGGRAAGAEGEEEEESRVGGKRANSLGGSDDGKALDEDSNAAKRGRVA